MKKVFVITLCIMMGVVIAKAQTNFRTISYQEALAAAKAEGKPVFIDFYTSWCGPCKMMAREVFPQQRVGDYFNQNFVCIKLDAEKEGREAAKKFSVTAYPTFKVITADEKVLFSIEGGNSDADAFINTIKAGVNPDLSPDRATTRYEQGDRSPELVAAYAALLMKESQANRRNPDLAKAEKAQQVVNDYFNGLNDSERLASENNFVYDYNYCFDPKDQKAQYLLEKLSTLPTDRRTEAEQTLNKLCLYRTSALLSGGDKFDESDVDELQKDVRLLAVDKGEETAWDATFRVLKAQCCTDRMKYIDQLERDFKVLTISHKASIAGNFSQALASDDLQVIRRADQWLRSELPMLDAASIMWASQSLITFERQLENKQNELSH
jgi:thiol-disulfide isomerase/thioredoxin